MCKDQVVCHFELLFIGVHFGMKWAIQRVVIFAILENEY